jgi:AhpD family alkylhydroperoxidase
MQVQAERLQQVDPANVERVMRAMFGLSGYQARSGLEPSLLELVNLRASQINGCAYCLDMHSKDARARGESEQRIYLLDAWRESPFYSERERAALAWAEAVTLVAETRVPDAVYEEVRRQFSDDELLALTMAVITINAANRLNVALRTVPGAYQPGMLDGVALEDLARDVTLAAAD